MVKGLYRSASGMLVRQVRMDAISNNIANVNTTGFKRDTIFAKRLIEAMPVVKSLDGDYAPLSDNLELYTDLSNGSFKATGSPLDAAISGTGFFVIQTPAGQMLTRNGNFHVNNEGTLVDSKGNAVEGSGGPISVPEDSVAFVNEHGEVISDGTVLGKLKIVDVENQQQLEKVGQNYYNSDGVAVNEQENSTLVTSSLEESNVNVMFEMVEMMSVHKEFEAQQKMIHTTDSTLDRLIREVGRGIG